MTSNFFGAWTLESYETLAADGTVTRPLGDKPIGLFSFHESGYFAVQLGKETGPGFTSFFGTADMPEGETGTIILKGLGGSNENAVLNHQVRNFTFMEPGLLRMRPPQTPEGAQSTIMWRRTGG